VAVETDGIYRIDLNMQFTGDVFDVGLSTAAITQIVDNSTPPIGAPDNLTWSPNGTLYVQEDGNGNDVWQMDADGANIAQIAHALSEPSGIFDISSLVGYQSGSLLLTSVQGSGGSGAQLSVLIAPDAALVPEPTTLALGFWAAVVFLITYMRRRQGLRMP
jgi:hypothetical protein